MTRKELERCCRPLTPEEALQKLKELYNWTSMSPRIEGEDDLVVLNAAIEVMRKVIQETKEER